MDQSDFNNEMLNKPLKVEVYGAKEYDYLLQIIKKEQSTAKNVFEYYYKKKKELNPEFLFHSLNAIEREQSKIYTKWIQVVKGNSEMNLETQVKKDPDFSFFESLKNFINELQNTKTDIKDNLKIELETIKEFKFNIIEKLLIINYLNIDSLKNYQFQQNPGKVFLSNLFEINPESIIKAFNKIDDYTKNNVSNKQAEQFIPTLRKVKQFFIDSELNKIASNVEIRINELLKFAGKD